MRNTEQRVRNGRKTRKTRRVTGELNKDYMIVIFGSAGSWALSSRNVICDVGRPTSTLKLVEHATVRDLDRGNIHLVEVSSRTTSTILLSPSMFKSEVLMRLVHAHWGRVWQIKDSGISFISFTSFAQMSASNSSSFQEHSIGGSRCPAVIPH